MKKYIFNTTNSYAPVAIRLLLAVVLFPHGAQKLLGWFGGYGFQGTMGYFTGQLGLPWLAGFMVIVIEFFAPLFLIAGLATRLWSMAVLALMTGIVITTIHDYFFMNWAGNQASEGLEYFLLVIGMAISLLISGGGAFAADALLVKKEGEPALPYYT